MQNTNGSGTTQQATSQPKQERSRRTKAQILQVAAEIFAEQGYPTVTLQAVAERASMTKGAVYFHYANKQALAIAVMEGHYARWPPLVEQVQAMELPPLQTLLAILDRTAEAFHTDSIVQAGARLQIERSLIGADLPQPYVGWSKLLVGFIAAAKEAGQLRAETDPETLARVVVSSFFGVQHISDVLTGRDDFMERYAEMRDVLFKGFVVA
ncbi:ScbR family autoregulator-binding transcription factor [Streptomyces sp. NPDC056486]|uniref:ScbR family autoregulator-binding transcription factor n=1 Tax=Streptomyces sp. NPDC056486 TaxID=3345835 RepID=UPI00369D52B8